MLHPRHTSFLLTVLLMFSCCSTAVNAGTVTMQAYYPAPDGEYQDLSVSNNIGIGTTVPAAELDVNGQIKISGGAPGANKVLTSSADGTATWELSGGSTVSLGACVAAAGPGCTNHGTILNSCPAANPALIGLYTQYNPSGCEGEVIMQLRCCALVLN